MVSHYRIVEKIGAGGMGEVYLAEDTKLDRKVALKFLPPHLCQDEDCRKRFKREAQAVAKLNHPNIITIHEVAEYQGRPFFAMELVEGQSLRDLVKGKQLSIDRIIELAIQVCDGLSAAHDKKVVHRDIKPSNIVIDAYGRPKILDFGLAAIQGGEHLTKTGSTLGTIGYMSPEQVKGQEVDQRSDLFSLGVVLYELISGRTPFEKENEAATLKAITQDNPEPLARYKSDIPDELQRTVSKLLEKDPSLRYQHADGVASDLKRMIAPTQSSIAVSPVRRPTRWPWWVGVVVAVAIIAVLAWQSFRPAQEGGRSEGKKMLAVLPFENLGSAEDEYFADGITDEITAKLATIRGLGVISRTSAMRYKNSDKSLPQIAKELGVGYILEGTIRWDKGGDTDRVRILPQLIRVSDDTHLWANTYERALTQIFSVQADIATQIAEALDVTLLDAERRSITAQCTENLEAYNLYLRAMELGFQPDYSEKSYQIRLELLQQAVELDPQFALAYAALSHTRSGMFNDGYDRTEHCLHEAKSAAQRALDLEPGLPEAHLALGWYYYMGHRDYDRALEEFTIAEEGLPGDSRIMMALGVINKRQGKFEKAIDYYKRGLELSPRDASMALETGISLQRLRRYADAERYYDLSITLAPDQHTGYQFKANVNIRCLGDLEKARETLLRVPAGEGRVLREWLYLRIFERDYEAGLAWLRTMPSETFIDQDSYVPRILSEARLYWYMGEREEALAAYDSARILLERKIEESPDDYRIHMSLGFAYAGIGDKEKAVHHGRRAVEFFPVSRDVLRGPALILSLAKIYVAVGDYEAALNELAYLLSIPSGLSVPLLRLDPTWDPLRDHPRFQALIEKYEKEHGI
jgi:TolB-like protein/Flp pilus assembly protein TadD/predicted Ser/Thr protein kinase